jgi:glycosyltransferase involved in cell wall biosynthesis
MVESVNIVGMMRIKNEGRWIDKVLRSMMPVCERIYILDDHSTDDTVAICRRFSHVTLWESEFDGLQETRDKNWLLSKIEERVPAGTWVIAIDGDEEIAPGGAEIIRRIAEDANAPNALRFHVQYLWDSESQWRTDGIYRDFHRPSMFRLIHGQRFHSAVGGGFHCGNVPDSGGAPRTAIRLLHYGYLHREDRVRKWDFYNTHDPRNHNEGYDPRFPERRTYPHIVQGDVPEVPANATLRWAGPISLEPLPTFGL